MGRRAGEGTSEEACEDTDVRAAGAHGQAQPTSFWYLRMPSSAAAHCAQRKGKPHYLRTCAGREVGKEQKVQAYFTSRRPQHATRTSHERQHSRSRHRHQAGPPHTPAQPQAGPTCVWPTTATSRAPRSRTASAAAVAMPSLTTFPGDLPRNHRQREQREAPTLILNQISSLRTGHWHG